MARVNLLSDFECEAISLVTKGANRKRFCLRKSGELSPVLVESPSDRELIAKADWSRVYCVVAEPGWQEDPGQLSADGVPDMWASEEEIAKAQRSFVRSGSRINKMHENLEPYGDVIDNAIALGDFEVTDPTGEIHTILKGSWYISIEPNEEGREKIDKGEFTGISIEGTATRTAIEKALSTDVAELRSEIAKAELIGADRLADDDVALLVEIEKSYREAVAKAGSSAALPDLDWSKGQNWIDKLPKALGAKFKKSWIYRTAKHLVYDEKMDRGRAFAVAVNAAKRGCASGDLNFKGKQGVNAKSREEMCSAVAVWTEMKAANKARVKKTSTGSATFDGMSALSRRIAKAVGMKPEEIDEAIAEDERVDVAKSASFAERLAADRLADQLPQGVDLLRSCIFQAVHSCDDSDPMPTIRSSVDEFVAWAGGLLGSKEAIAKQLAELPEGWDESSVRPDEHDFDSMERNEVSEVVGEEIAKALPAALETALKPVSEMVAKLVPPADDGEPEGEVAPVAKAAKVDELSETLNTFIASTNEAVAKIGADIDALASGDSEQNNGEPAEPVKKSGVQGLAEEIL